MADWPNEKYAYNSSNLPTYRGLNMDIKANNDDPGWHIFKYYYDSNNNTTQIKGALIGKWSERDSLGWG